jgi:hypothetical protein
MFIKQRLVQFNRPAVAADAQNSALFGVKHLQVSGAHEDLVAHLPIRVVSNHDGAISRRHSHGELGPGYARSSVHEELGCPHGERLGAVHGQLVGVAIAHERDDRVGVVPRLLRRPDEEAAWEYGYDVKESLNTAAHK